MKNSFFAALAVSASMLCPAAAMADQYPDRAIHVIAPFAPGGGSDIAARQFGQFLTDQFKVDAIVENRPGAGGSVGARQVAKAASDGYTLLLGTMGNQIVNQYLLPDMNFDPAEDLVAVGWFSNVPNVLVVRSDSPFKTAEELIAAAKDRPNGLIYGSGGMGTSTHLAVELFGDMGGLKLTHVPYKGSAPAIVDLIGGRVDFLIDNLISSETQIKSGRLRVLAVATKERLAAYPDVPAISELPGFEGYQAVSWTGIFAPKGTPPDRIDILSKAMSSEHARQDMSGKVAATGAQYVGEGAGRFNEFLVEERGRWVPIAKRLAASN